MAKTASCLIRDYYRGHLGRDSPKKINVQDVYDHLDTFPKLICLRIHLCSRQSSGLTTWIPTFPFKVTFFPLYNRKTHFSSILNIVIVIVQAVRRNNAKCWCQC